MVEQDINQW